MIKAQERTKLEMFTDLISNTKITGRPSDYLRDLLFTASKVEVFEELVPHLFIQGLPQAITPALAAATSHTLSELGALSDKILPFIKSNLIPIFT